MPKNLINQMVKCAKKLLNLLTKWANMLKGCLHQGGKRFGGRVCARITSFFSFPTHIYAHFRPKNYKRLQNIFNVLQNKDKTEIQNALCNFSKSPHMFKLPIVWLGALCGLCICPYINGLRSALVSEYSLSGCLCGLGLCWRLGREIVSAFDGFVYL